MAITIRYAGTREEIRRWYWQVWRKSLWKIQMIFFVLIVLCAVSLDGHWPIRDYRFLGVGVLAASGLLAFLVLFPQLMYKPQTRTLIVNEAGIRTSIGSKSGDIRWAEILQIEDTSEYVILTGRKNLDAFVIPGRAFQTEAERANFLAAVRAWHASATNKGPGIKG